MAPPAAPKKPSRPARADGKKPGGRHRGALLAGLVLAGAGFLFLRRSSSTSTEAEYAASTEAATPSTIDDGGSAADSGLDALTSLVDVLITRQDSAEASADEFESEVTTALDDVEATLAGLTPTDSSPTGQTPTTAPGNKKATSSGFWWTIAGKQTWVTKDDKKAFLAELKRKGANVDVWASKHPAAARMLGLSVPTSPPPKKKKKAKEKKPKKAREKKPPKAKEKKPPKAKKKKKKKKAKK